MRAVKVRGGRRTAQLQALGHPPGIIRGEVDGPVCYCWSLPRSRLNPYRCGALLSHVVLYSIKATEKHQTDTLADLWTDRARAAVSS